MKRLAGILFLGIGTFMSFQVKAASQCAKVHSTVRESISDEFIEARTKDFIEKRRCTCCHTTLTFAMSVQNPQNSSVAKILKNYITERMAKWDNYSPWPGPYPSQKVRATEAILNAVSMVAMDAKGPTGRLSPMSYRALKIMLQEVGVRKWPDGRVETLNKSFEWIDHLSLAPFEGANADYWGAAMAAETVSKTPKSYQNRPEVREKVEVIQQDLKERFEGQDLHNRLVAIIASRKMGNFLEESKVRSTLEAVLALQKTESGKFTGWSLPDIANSPRPLSTTAYENVDAYATSLVAIALMTNGDRGPRVKEALEWLVKEQQANGSWLGHSLQSGTVTAFMTDTASGYARMAIELGSQHGLIP